MISSILKSCKILKIEDSLSTGQAATTSDVIDMKGFNGACFIYKLGAVTDAAVVTLSIAQGTDDTVSDTAALSGATATLTGDSDSEQSLVVDVVKPQERYLQATLTITVQNAEIDSGFVILYDPIAKPVSQPATIDDSTLVVSPDES